MEFDVVESILERVPIKSLLRFKCVSKRWKFTIESKNFQERQLIHRQKSPGPDLLFVTKSPSSSFSFVVAENDDDYYNKIISLSPVTSIKVHIKEWFHFSTTCDGLLCMCDEHESIIINPTTRWHRTFPLSNFQKQQYSRPCMEAWLGFGKDKFNGTYKSVWLYNNTQKFDNKKTITTCEVFDFRDNIWRYVTCPASPYDIIPSIIQVHLEGSILWLTKSCESEDIQVLSFDLHTETFQVIAKAPFTLPHADLHQYEIHNIQDHLCICEINGPTQVVWLFDSGSKTWNHICSIDLKITCSSWFRKSTTEVKWMDERLTNYILSLTPVTVLEEKNKKPKILFYFNFFYEPGTYFVTYDSQTQSFDLAFTFNSPREDKYWGWPLCYFESLISIP